MNYRNLIRELAVRSNVTIKDTAYIMNNLKCIIEEEILRGNSITLLGLFSIVVRETNEKTHNNVNINEVVKNKKHKKIKLIVNREFKNKIKNSK